MSYLGPDWFRRFLNRNRQTNKQSTFKDFQNCNNNYMEFNSKGNRGESSSLKRGGQTHNKTVMGGGGSPPHLFLFTGIIFESEYLKRSKWNFFLFFTFKILPP